MTDAPVRLPGGRRGRLVTLLALATVLPACERLRDPRAASTIRMARLLEDAAGSVDPANPWASAAKLAELRAVPEPSEPRARARYLGRVAEQLLNVGRAEEAVATLRRAHAIAASGDPTPHLASAIQSLLAAATLQLAVEEACVRASAIDGCLLPTPVGGDRPGSEQARAAIREYDAMLRLEPDNLGERWLLNVAHMLAGSYPAAVPAARLIPPAALAAEHDLRRFPDIAPRLGVDVLGHAGGAIMDDFDGDGLLDIVASSWRLGDQLRLFRNTGYGRFVDRTVAAGLEGITGGLNVVHADYDNDGHLDVLVLRGGWQPEGSPNSLLRNRGDGTFEDVTEAAGLLRPFYPTQTATWGDFDNDGWLDLFIGNESPPGARNPSQLFRNNGDGTFTDVAASVGAAVTGYNKGVAWGDIDNDGLIDLYVSRLAEPNMLLRNGGADGEGRWRFIDVTRAAGVAEPVMSFPTWFWDYDNDGWLDILVFGYLSQHGDIAAEYLGLPHGSEPPRLYQNNGDGSFTDVTTRAGLDRIVYAMGSNYGDFDNDGWLDFYAGTGNMDFRALMPNRAFRNAEGRTFQDVTTAGGFGHMQKGHGVAFGDWDGDGDDDLYMAIGGAHDGDAGRNVLFQNPSSGQRWITLRLEGVRANRTAIGARVAVRVETPAGERLLHRVVSSGGSFGGNSLQLEIGLGDGTAVRSVTVVWPGSGTRQTWADLAPDRVYRLREGVPQAHVAGNGRRP